MITTKISEKDNEILQLYKKGKTYKEIGKIVFMSHRTVEARLSKLRFKYDCRNNRELIDKLL